MYFAAGSKLVIIGDSITDAGRDKGIGGEGLFNAHGSGYVALLNAHLFARFPERRLRLVNQGNSGNTVRDLAARWQNDVFGLKPDYVAMMIGINDVWRQFDLPLMTDRHVCPEEYEKTLDELVARTAPTVKGMILLTPYFIEPNREDAMRARMDVYGDLMRRVAERHGCLLVDVQGAFDRYLQHYHPAQLAWDRIHPNLAGHQVIANAFLAATGCLNS